MNDAGEHEQDRHDPEPKLWPFGQFDERKQDQEGRGIFDEVRLRSHAPGQGFIATVADDDLVALAQRDHPSRDPQIDQRGGGSDGEGNRQNDHGSGSPWDYGTVCMGSRSLQLRADSL